MARAMMHAFLTLASPWVAAAAPLVSLKVEGTPVLFDPVLLTVSIKNDGAEPVSLVVPRIGSPYSTTVILYTSSPQMATPSRVEFPGIYAGAMKSLSSPPPLPIILIEPGETKAFPLRVTYNFPPANEHEREWLFPKPGKCKLEAEIYVLPKAIVGRETVPADSQMVSVRSTPADFVVTAPAEEGDVRAMEALRHLKNEWLLYAPWYAGNTVPEEIEQFRKDYINSRYAKFTALVYGYADFWRARVDNNDDAAERAQLECRRISESAADWPPGWKSIADELADRTSRELKLLRLASRNGNEPTREKDAFVTFGPVLAQEAREQIETILSQYSKAFSSGDLDACLSLLTPDFKYRSLGAAQE